MREPSELAEQLRNAAVLDDWPTFDSLIAELRRMDAPPSITREAVEAAIARVETSSELLATVAAQGHSTAQRIGKLRKMQRDAHAALLALIFGDTSHA